MKKGLGCALQHGALLKYEEIRTFVETTGEPSVGFSRFTHKQFLYPSENVG